MNSCKDCKFAEFEMTKHNPPRINANHYGKCHWPLPETFPVARSVAYGPIHKTVIWVSFHDCPVWEPKP